MKRKLFLKLPVTRNETFKQFTTLYNFGVYFHCPWYIEIFRNRYILVIYTAFVSLTGIFTYIIIIQFAYLLNIKT